MSTELIQIGAVGVIFVFAIREFFLFMRTKKNGNGNVNKQLLEAITKQNENHLHTIQETMEAIVRDINAGNNRVVDSITNGNMKIIELLGAIKGKLSK